MKKWKKKTDSQCGKNGIPRLLLGVVREYQTEILSMGGSCMVRYLCQRELVVGKMRRKTRQTFRT